MRELPIDHHFTPVFYLNAWAGADGRVTRYSRPRDVVVAKSNAPSRTGSEQHLYTLQGVAPERQAAIETEFFKPVDSRAAIAHAKLLRGELNSLSPEQRVDWARFMMSMQNRSPFSLGELERLGKKIMREIPASDEAAFQAKRKPGDPDSFYEYILKYEPDMIANYHKLILPKLIDNQGMGSHLINMDWALASASNCRFTLLTGDRPFVWTFGWKDPRAVLLFPLSPDMLLVLTNRRSRTVDVLQHNRSRLVSSANDQIVQCAVDFVIGSDASHLAFVERRLRPHGQEPIPGPGGRGRPGCPA